MNKTSRVIFILALLAITSTMIYFLFFVDRKENHSAVVQTRQLQNTIITNKSNTSEVVSLNNDNVILTANIDLNQNETLLDTFTMNIDDDTTEEQILVVNKSNVESTTLSIVIADYSQFTRKWYRAWEGDTLVTKIKTFQININDPVGDHNVSLICTGMNDTNEQTMTIYRKETNSEIADMLSFIKIFDQTGSTIIVDETDRSDSYKLIQSNAPSWSISIWKSDPESTNILDQIHETWQWNFSDNKYILVTTEKITGISIEQKRTLEILDGTVETFSNFLAGTWYNTSVDPLAKNALYMTFIPEEKTILFSSEELIEVYDWETSNPTKLGLYVSSTNNSVKNLSRLIDIALSSTDSIRVRVFQNMQIRAEISDKWNGEYKKYTDNLASSFKRKNAAAETKKDLLLGIYDGQDGSVLEIDGNTYKYVHNAITERGSVSIYSLSDKTIIDMRNDKKRNSYELDISKTQDESGIEITNVKLTKIRISINGVEYIQNEEVLNFTKR